MKMPEVDFEAFKYVPSLRTRQAELRGYEELSGDCKDPLLPVFVLGKLHRQTDPQVILARVIEAAGNRPFLCDLTSTEAHALERWDTLRSPQNGFENWVDFCRPYETIVPVAQITRAASMRDVIRQVIALEENHGAVAIRCEDPVTDVGILEAALSAVVDVNKLLTILDFGYMRGSVRTLVPAAANTINRLRTVDGRAQIVCMATSYPRSVTPYGDAEGSLEIEERLLHEALGGDPVVTYGDHASIHSVAYDESARAFVPRIDYPTAFAWTYRRLRQDAGGYRRCAEQIVRLEGWDPALTEFLWGAQAIENAASGQLEGMGSPAGWISARVNIHLYRQANFTPTGDEEED